MALTRRRAVIDRIEDGQWAVLLVGRTQTEMHIPVEELPEGAREGTWLRVRTRDNTVTDIVVDMEETERGARRIRSKMDALRQRGRRFKPLGSHAEDAEVDTSEEGQPKGLQTGDWQFEDRRAEDGQVEDGQVDDGQAADAQEESGQAEDGDADAA